MAVVIRYCSTDDHQICSDYIVTIAIKNLVYTFHVPSLCGMVTLQIENLTTGILKCPTPWCMVH